MKKQNVPLFLGAWALALSPLSTTATLLAFDDFNGGTGSAALGSGGTTSFGWGGDWTNQTGTGQFSGGTPTDLTTNTFDPSGVTLGFLGSSNERAGRNLDTSGGGNFAAYLDGSSNIGADGTTLYLSFLLGTGDGVTNYYGLELHRDGDNDAARILQVAAESNAALDLRANNTASTGENFFTQTSRVADTFVVELSFGAGTDQARVYVNPLYNQPQGASTANATITASDLSFDRISFGNFSGRFIDFDDVRVGTSWADVAGATAIPEPSTVALLLGGLSVLSLRRRER